MNADPGPVREEAERLVAAVLARLALVRMASGRPSLYDPQRASRIARATGEVAVAVTGLLRELAQPAPDGSAMGTGLRKNFATLATGLVEALGVDLRGEPPPPRPWPWQAGAAADTGDVWRIVTRQGQSRPPDRPERTDQAGQAQDVAQAADADQAPDAKKF